ncbi:MAG TPA: methyltransferase domain-containing protein [Thermoanaerobaculia bacterium]|nr:methyltransferase domain-containing protein [Thermoanaerobaculia bacterium]
MIDIHDYEEKYAGQYAAGTFETVLVRVRRKVVLEALARYAHGTILEVGCGLEPLFRFVDDGAAFTIVEPSPEFVQNARALAEGRAVRVVEGFLETASLPETFDFIVVSSLLHEVSDPAALLAAVRSRCHAGTTVHFNVPNVRSFHRLLALESGLIGDLFEQSETERRFQRHTRFDRERLEALLRANGFEVLDCATYFVKPFTHAQMDALVQSGTCGPEVIEGLDRMTKYMPDMGCEIYANVRLT